MDLSDSAAVTDEVVSAVAHGCRHLQSLNLNRCWNVTSAAGDSSGSGGGFAPIATLQELRTLELSGYMEQRKFTLNALLPKVVLWFIYDA